jgi:hypothetical protein
MAMGVDKHGQHCTRWSGVLRYVVLTGLLLAGNSALATVTSLNATDCRALEQANVISAQNPLPCNRLARVSFAYIDFNGNPQSDGEMIVMDAVAPFVEHLMEQLRVAGFPLRGARSLKDYAGDDLASMTDNNSSAFNGRPMTGGGDWSKHAYGAAIDINPLQNPYISHATGGNASVLPPAAAPVYIDRTHLRPGMAETIRPLLADNGFLTWGGNWHQPVDYQHFEIGSRAFIEKLTRSTPDEARALFARYVRTYRDCASLRTTAAALETCTVKTMRGFH